jgi:hypothetical protein
MLNIKLAKGRNAKSGRTLKPMGPAFAPISAAAPLTYSQLETIAVLVMAAAVLVLFILAAYFTDRNGDIDEIGLFNPTYMYLHYGKMSYPIHGFYDSMIVHPPVHYALIGTLMRLGFSLYYAQATPTLLMVLICIWLIVRAPFTAPVKIGLLYGLWVSMAVFGRFGIEMFGMRPEGHLGAAWLAGLILLESGRLRNWNPIELFAGAFFLAYACSLHYYAAAGAAGAVVYVVWAAWTFRWRSWKALLAITAGALMYGLPFLTIYFLPHQHAILDFIKSTQNGGGVREVLDVHLKEYQYWARYKAGNFWLQIPVSLGIPIVLLSTPILFALRSTRGIALAALPLELFLLLFAHHKHAYYYIHEVALYSAAVVAGTLTIADRFLTKWKLPGARAVGWTAFGLMIAVSFWNLNKWDGKLTVSLQPRVHEAEIARTAGRAILGPYATVATRIGPWYSSGGDYWYNPAQDVLWVPGQTLANVDMRAYFSHFDAVVEDAHMSDATENVEHHSLLSWYLDGTLRLRGFFFSQVNAELTNLYFQTKPTQVTGYGLRNGQLLRFTEAPGGDSELVVLNCPAASGLATFYSMPLSVIMSLPQANPAEPRRVLAVVLVNPAGRVVYESSLPDAHLVQRVRGDLRPVDWRKMLEELRQTDQTMHFYRQLNQIPGVSL